MEYTIKLSEQDSKEITKLDADGEILSTWFSKFTELAIEAALTFADEHKFEEDIIEFIEIKNKRNLYFGAWASIGSEDIFIQAKITFSFGNVVIVNHFYMPEE